MTSEWLLMLIVGVWVAFLLPLWVRGNRNPHLQQVDKFSKAMATLRDDSLLAAGQPARPTVSAKRAVRSGRADLAKQRRLQQRRRAFGAFLSTIPLAAGLYAPGLLPVGILLLPVLAFVAFVVFARYSIAQARNAQPVQPGASSRPSAPPRSLFAGLTAVRRAAAERLLATEREVETELTPGWQPTGERQESTVGIGGAWSAPEPVLPTYVSAPAATAVPRQIDREHGTWDGAAMVDAAARQRETGLAELVADLTPLLPPAPAVDPDLTDRLPRVAGA